MALLEDVKDYLKITWEHEDVMIQGIIDRGIDYLQDLTATEMNFDKEGQPKALLLDYCRYSYNNAIEYYEENFQRQIVRLQFKEGIKASKEVIDNEG